MGQSWGTFLKLILPANGQHQYCIGQGADGPTQEVFVPTIEDLIAKADQLQSQGAQTGAVYFSISSLEIQKQGKQLRQKQHGLTNKTLLLDIDIRDNRPNHHHDMQAAIVSLFTICANDGLPQPSAVIHSGRGAHVYWALDEEITGAEYRSLGEHLAEFLKQRDPKLVSDPRATKNNITFIRMPGSTNNKVNPPHVVGYYEPNGAVLGNGHAYSPDTFAALFGVNRSVLHTAGGGAPKPQANAAQHQGQARVVDPIVSIKSSEDYYRACAVMAHLRDKRKEPASSPDYVSYDAWRCGVALLARTEDAQTAVHTFSEGAETYDPAKVDKQLSIEIVNQANTTGPITCETLCSHIAQGRNLCQGCKFYKTNGGSPYRAAKTTEEARETAESTSKAVASAHTVNAAPIQGAAPTTAHGAPLEILKADSPSPHVQAWQQLRLLVESEEYIPMDALGIQKDPAIWGRSSFPVELDSNGHMVGSVSDGKGNYETATLCNSVIWPLRYVKKTDSDRSDIQVCIAKFEDNRWLARLGTLGYDIAGGGAAGFKQELMGFQAVVGWNPKAQAQLLSWFQGRVSQLKAVDTLNMYTTFGWHEELDGTSFVVGPYVFKPGGTTQIASIAPALRTLEKQYFKLSGSFEGAQSVLNYVWHHGTDEAKLAIMLGAGAPMTYKSSTPGAYVNIWGDNGAGKSLVASLVRGIWGDGKSNNSPITEKNTMNAYYDVLSRFKNLPVVFDEATEVHLGRSPKMELGTLLYSTSEGKGKGRALQSGESAEVLNWNTLVIATSNANIREHYEGIADNRDAKVARAYEINVDRPVINAPTVAETNQTMMRLGEAMEASSGVAGLALARYLVDNKHALEKTMDGLRDWLTKKETKTDADTRIRRAINSIAIVGGQMLAATNLWSATSAEIVDVVMRMSAKIEQQNADTQQNPLHILSTMAHQLLGNLDWHEETPQGVTPIARSATSVAGDGVKAYSKYDMKGRKVDMPHLGITRYSILEETVKEYLKRRGIHLSELMKRLQKDGVHIEKRTVDLFGDSKYPVYGDIGPQAPSVPVPCVVFDYKLVASGKPGSFKAVPPNQAAEVSEPAHKEAAT